ncbi:TRAP transporter permease [Stutzerimonas kunmingensis]|uniref:TRAP transporter permease n=1 Tax=Stutzerimonas kunmingensis TaxID=1211807 RepID=UPI0028B09AB4|nr:TRAP transporter permease [Stutzerimonas kunmingensis]
MQDKQLSTEELIAQDVGARLPEGPMAAVIAGLALLWSLFQLWIASPLPFVLGFGVLNDTETRSIHLAFALLLAFLAYPAFKRSPRDRVPLFDIALGLIAASTAAYLFIVYEQLAQRPGNLTTMDLITACLGIPLLLEATRRALGPPLAIIALVFLVYSVAGPWMPGLLAHRGVSFTALANHQWITTEGVFGIALGVSTSFVFLFVLFGALLERAGAGHYFIQLAFSMLGHFRGGPAKAAVVASGMTGLISGSSIANVVTTGTFTIPMMKRTGFSAEKAGAVEVASSVNGQIMPPVMGAAAFLMVEYVGIPYVEVIKHAFLPALISYIALVYIVHLESLKLGLTALPRANVAKPWMQRLIGFAFGAALISGLSLGVYYGLGWLKPALGDSALWVIGALLALVYLGLLKIAASNPPLPHEDPDAPLEQLPETRPVLLSGLHFLLPVVVLVWCLMIERLSPGLSAFWGSVMLVIILLTQRPLLSMLRKDGTHEHGTFMDGVVDLREGLIAGARNMIGIGIATAAAGIIVGAVSQTGVGLVLADLVELLSMGNLLLMLLLTAFLSLILGMGLPTTANYIVVSSLLAPVIVALGQQNGLIVPLIAVHLFVFYFGIMADVTPPVGLASFAAAAVSKGDPIKTGITAFYYSLRTAALPFLFIFNTDLLLIDVDFWHGVLIFVVATIAMLIFAAGTQGYFLVRSRWYESLLLLVAFNLFRPGFWMDIIHDPYRDIEPAALVETLERVEEDSQLRLRVLGEDDVGDPREFVVLLAIPDGESGEEKLEKIGLMTYKDDGKVLIDSVTFGSPAAEAGLEFDQQILRVRAPTDRWPKEFMWIPGFLLFGLIVWMQRRRRQR